MGRVLSRVFARFIAVVGASIFGCALLVAALSATPATSISDDADAAAMWSAAPAPIDTSPPAPTPEPTPDPTPTPVVAGVQATPVARAAPPPRASVAPVPASSGTVLASWYGPGFYGNRTACGQTYTPQVLGVAHRTLPCGTPVTITFGGSTVTVPVIDRGPFTPGRTLDLSNAVRIALGCTDLCWVGMRLD